MSFFQEPIVVCEAAMAIKVCSQNNLENFMLTAEAFIGYRSPILQSHSDAPFRERQSEIFKIFFCVKYYEVTRSTNASDKLKYNSEAEKKTCER